MTEPSITPGLSAELVFTVGEYDTAPALGSGDVAVLASPRLVAWLEAASVAAVAGVLPDGSTTVGSRVDMEHSAPTPVGGSVTVRAEVVGVDGRLVDFTWQAEDESASIASGRHRRVVVDRARFLDRVDRSR